MARDESKKEKIFSCSTCNQEFEVEKAVSGKVATAPLETSFYLKELGRRVWRATCRCGTVESFSLIGLVREVGDRGS